MDINLIKLHRSTFVSKNSPKIMSISWNYMQGVFLYLSQGESSDSTIMQLYWKFNTVQDWNWKEQNSLSTVPVWKKKKKVTLRLSSSFTLSPFPMHFVIFINIKNWNSRNDKLSSLGFPPIFYYYLTEKLIYI